MQRINLFPSPGFLNGIWGSANHTVNNGEMKVLYTAGDTYSAITASDPGRDELVLSIEVKGSGNIQVFDSDWKFLANTGVFHNVHEWTVKNMRFTQTAGKDLFICFYPADGWLTVRRPQLELASTYDAAVGGGASGLLHGRHDATRIGASVGRVMSDDGDELAPASESGHQTRNMEQSERHRERGRNPNLPFAEHHRHCESFFWNVRGHVRAWRVHLRRQVQGEAHKSRSIWRHCRAQRRKGWGLGVPASRECLLVTEFRFANRRSDTDRAGDLHARRLGEIAVNGSDVVRRGHDAARLTPLGVMA